MNKLKLIVIAAFALAMLAVPSAASARDRNHDKIPDRWEKKFHLSTTHNVAKKDPDHDGLNNRKEFKDSTNPRDADTDNDGMDDGDEVEVGDNPNDKDSNDDGVKDGNEIAGTIQHFDSSTGVLTILLADGTTTRSGSVTSATEIKCEGGDDNGGLHASSHGGDDGANHDSGDDNGGSDDRSACTTADLTDGRVVHEAELGSDSNGQPAFSKVELDRQ
jgi:Ni/Co efflux regulator RcnB